MLCRLEHRGSQGGDDNTGDGAGILIQLPHSFFRKSCSQLSKKQRESYGVGMVFLPQDSKLRSQCENEFERIIAEEGQEWLGWRTVPVNDGVIGGKAKEESTLYPANNHWKSRTA